MTSRLEDLMTSKPLACITKDRLISVVVHLHNNADIVEDFSAELLLILEDRFTDFEVIFVDDASTDLTRDKMKDLLSRYEGVRYLRLSRHFGREISVYAGMQSAIGDYVVLMNIQTDPPALIPELIDRAVRHGGIVFGTCEHRLDEPALYPWFRSLFVWVSVHWFNIPLVKNATQLMVFSRQALNAFLEIKDRHRQTRVFTAYIGYTQEGFDYKQIPRGKMVSKRSLADGLQSGLRIILAASVRPLRLITSLGVLAALINAAVVLVLRIRTDRFHWSLLFQDVLLQLGCMFVVLMTVLMILTEYITLLLEESHDRPMYYAHEEQTSSVLLADRGRRNITE